MVKVLSYEQGPAKLRDSIRIRIGRTRRVPSYHKLRLLTNSISYTAQEEACLINMFINCALTFISSTFQAIIHSRSAVINANTNTGVTVFLCKNGSNRRQ